MNENIPMEIQADYKYVSPTKIAAFLQSNYVSESALARQTFGLLPLGAGTPITLGGRLHVDHMRPDVHRPVDRVNFEDFAGGLNPVASDTFYLFGDSACELGFVQLERGFIHTPYRFRGRIDGQLQVGAEISVPRPYETATVHVGHVLRGNSDTVSSRTRPFRKRVLVEPSIDGKIDVLEKDVIYFVQQPSRCRWKYAGNVDDYILAKDMLREEFAEDAHIVRTLGQYKAFKHTGSKLLPKGPAFSDRP